ncbi:MAG: TonB-dependent receptor [Thiobacillus sp.]|nr:TonB-dependent receptor [Thiobacillus sp.]
MKQILKIMAAGLACAHGAGAWAASADTFSEDLFLAELPLVSSASRLPQAPDRAPAAVTVITREMIEASGFRQLPDVFRLVPGMQVSWVAGNIPTVTYQGLSSIFSRHVQVLVDGRSVYNPGYGSVQWRGIPLALDDVDRIEVVRGPNAATDGANAVAASIHIFTRPVAATPGWTVAGALGSTHIRDGLVRHAGSRGDWQWRLTLNSRQDDWLDGRDDRARDHLLDSRVEWRPSARDELTFQAGGALGEWNGSTVDLAFSPKQTTDFSSAYVQARWLRTLSADNEWSLRFDHTYTRADERFPPLFGVLDPDNFDYWFSRSALEFSMQARPFESLRTVWTAEARQDRARSPSLVGPETHAGNMYRLSGNAEWGFAPDWVLHAGLMLEKHYNAGTRFSPRVAVNWLPAAGHAFRLGASRAWRSPTILEQESDFALRLGGAVYDQILLSPFELKPERMDSAELGYLFHRGRLSLDTRLYHNRLVDIIDSDSSYVIAGEISNSISNIVFANLNEARQTGFEYQLRWQSGKATWLTLAQSWAVTRGDTRDLRRSAPAHQLALLANHDFGPVVASLGYYRRGTMRWVNYDDVPAHDRLDLRLAKRFKWNGARAEVALVGQSLLGDYLEMKGEGDLTVNPDRAFGRRGYVSLRLDY